MYPLVAISHSCFSRINLVSAILPICTQVRWRKTPKRKPRWLPMAPSKVFRIPKHPYVPPDQKQLELDQLEEYYRAFVSLRKVFQDEIQQKTVSEDEILLLKQKDEEEFRRLLEENRKENERIRIIREQTLEREFQDECLQLLELAEETKKEQEEAKLRVEAIVREMKEKRKSYITLENIDQMIEKAIDSPMNPSFTISVNGIINWEGKPSVEYEAEITRRVAKGKES